MRGKIQFYGYNKSIKPTVSEKNGREIELQNA